jgi:hypothetical protein
MAATGSDVSGRWRQMQDALERARTRPIEVIEAVAGASDREEAAAALSGTLDLDEWIADQLLDLHVSEFIGQLRSTP